MPQTPTRPETITVHLGAPSENAQNVTVGFADYIKKFAEIQFILITHRRGTMEAADRMYGVTMPEQGVSKVIELNVYEFEQRREEFLK